jgi:predicted DNA-binding transcriptional regulator AlpA
METRPRGFARPVSNNGDFTMQIQTNQFQAENPPALLTLAMIRRYYVPIASRTLFRLISSGRFPKADIGIGGKLRLWKRDTVEAWIASNAVRVGVE